MPRVARVDVADMWYHVIARGQRRDALFLAKSDRIRYLQELTRALERHGGLLGAYCLMTNHVHLLIYRGPQSLGQIFVDAHGRYGRYFNRTHRKVGYVFQGRFKSFLVLRDDYLAALVRYIHLNPVEAGMVRVASVFRWSSDGYYRGGKADENVGEVLERVPGYEGRAGTRKYVQMMSADDGGYELPRWEQYIGDEQDLKGCERRTRKRTLETRGRRGAVSLEARIKMMEKDMGFDVSRLRSARRTQEISKIRQRAMAKLYDEGYPPVHIARQFDKTPSAVLRAVERAS